MAAALGTHTPATAAHTVALAAPTLALRTAQALATTQALAAARDIAQLEVNTLRTATLHEAAKAGGG